MDQDKLKGKYNEAMGGAKEKFGDASEDEEMHGEGTGQKYKGKAQGAWGDVKDKARDITD